MRRRDFISLLGGTAAWPLAARGQQPAIPVIGVLSAGHSPIPDSEAAFERGLAERGYVVGRNVTIEPRWARGNYDRLPELAQEIVRLNPALIRAGGNVVALAARGATSTIPIVFTIASDPVKIGLAKSLAHPGGNATGVSIMTATLTLKRLELIRELLPQRDRRLLGKPGKSRLVAETEGVARSTGQSLSLVVANARPA
jgi:putative ABC transport system substrate-binding protein